MPRALLPSDLTQPATWLLSLTWAGRTFRLSSQPVEVTSDSGTYQYTGGLSPIDIEQALALLADSPDQRSVSIEALLPEVDVPAMIADGHDLAAARGELALWYEGTTYEERLVLVDGRASQPEYGGADEAIAFSLVEEPYDDTAMIPPSTAKVSPATWADSGDGSIGAIYPTVFGAPGVWTAPDGTVTEGPGSPGVCIKYDSTTGRAWKLLIADHRCVATTAKIWYPIDGAEGAILGPYAITYETDGLGREVAVIDLVTVAIAEYAMRSAGEWWICWSEGDAMESPYRSGVGLSRAGDVLRYMADRSSLRWNRGRLMAAAAQLGARVDGFYNERITPWEWVVDNLLPLVPVSVSSDEDGLYPVIWRHDARASQAIDHLEVGAGIARTARVEYDKKPHEVVNEWTVRHSKNPASGEFQRATILTPNRDADDPEQFSNAHARSSSLRYASPYTMLPLVRADEVASDIVYADSTAAYVAAWHVMAYGFASRSITYEMGTERAWWDLGDVVTLTDAELAMVEVVALVQSMTITDVGIVTVRLQILDDIETRQLTTGTALAAPSWGA